jgi:hypothetical protein
MWEFVPMSDAYKIGEHEAKIDMLVTGMAQLQQDVSDIKSTLAEKRGERRVGLWVSSTASGAIGAVMTLLLRWWFGAHPR